VDVAEARTLKPVDPAKIAAKELMSELDIQAVLNNDSTYLDARPGVKYYRKPFEFLSLGLLAYIGNDKALTQVRGWQKGGLVVL
jgi:hypothetical protein